MPGQRLVDVGALFDEDLHEGAGFLLGFPWQRALAGGQLDQHVAHALGLTNLDDHIFTLVVALVEQPQGRDPVFHRGAEFAFHDLPRNPGPGQVLGHFSGIGIGIAAAAGGQRNQRGQQGNAAAQRSQPSGDQAS